MSEPGRPAAGTLPMTRLGATLMNLRERSDATRDELARRAGLSPNTLMKIEQGKTKDPGLFKVAAVCRALSVSVDHVVGEALSPEKEGHAMTHGIVSVGYEGRSIDDFVTLLGEHGVTTVADVRLNPISRKPGFSKTRLTAALDAAGIDYRHLRGLGNQKENRAPFWEGRIDEGRETFRSTLSTPEAVSALDELASLAHDSVVAVLCFEASQDNCHRHVVIDEVTQSRHVPVVQV